MITPKQVMEELQYYISEFGMDYYIEIKNGKHFPVTTAYLSQQKKKDNLLKLYHDFNYGDYDAETDYDICKQIKALEEELK